MNTRRGTMCAVVLAVFLSGTARPASDLTSLDGKAISIPEMEAAITRIMEKAAVTGMSCAVIHDSKIAYCKAFGLKNRKTGESNNKQTIFASASLSKTVFAYLVMLLVEEGVVDLDKPLHEYLKKPLPDYTNYEALRGDHRYTQITARLCLTHSTGLAWRGSAENRKMILLFNPGDRCKYSNEGINLLQMVVEELAGKGLEELAQATVFEPLGMTRTSFIWQDVWEEDIAIPHDQYERPRRELISNKSYGARASASMRTTAGDYAHLLLAIIGAEGKRKAIMDEMLRSQVTIRSNRWFSSEQTDEYDPIHLSWGLGWVRFDSKHGRAFLHIGRFRGCQNYTVTYADKGIGVVFLSNSANFESVARELTAATIGDMYSPFDWCGYPHYDPNTEKESPLHLAAYFGQRDIVERLLAEGADVRAQNRDGRTAAGLAKENGHTEVVESIYKHAEQSGDSREIMTFFDCAATGDMEKIRSFMSRDMDVNATTQSGTTPLHLAISKDYKGLPKLLIENGANCRAVDKNGITPLHLAARGHIDVMKLLIDKGADVNANAGTWAGTPLHYAAHEGHVDGVKLLIANGANINSRNNNDATPLHWAASGGHIHTVELLLAKGAEVNAKNKEGSTPFDFATSGGYSEAAELLRKHGAKE